MRYFVYFKHLCTFYLWRRKFCFFEILENLCGKRGKLQKLRKKQQFSEIGFSAFCCHIKKYVFDFKKSIFFPCSVLWDYGEHVFEVFWLLVSVCITTKICIIWIVPSLQKQTNLNTNEKTKVFLDGLYRVLFLLVLGNVKQF